MQKGQQRALMSRKARALSGTCRVPGDKSISHRSIMFGGIAEGETKIYGLLQGEDVLCTVEALRAVGAEISEKDGVWTVRGVGLQNLGEPGRVLDLGNSGTSARLLIGLFGARPFTTFFTGDASLCKRPMKRVISPLEQMGARFMSREGGRFPLAVQGPKVAAPISYRLPVASAQVKSAVLLAGLSADGVTTVIEDVPTRDHSERMLRAFGADLKVERREDGAEAISITGGARLIGREVRVPADISSAAFPMVAALLVPGSAITLTGVGLNPRRAGIVETLREMGASIAFSNESEASGEPTADLRIEASALRGVVVPPERAPSMIDEFPVLAMAAACAAGTTRMCGLGELRVKESDRLALVAEGLVACGAKLEIEGDDLIVHGTGKPPRGGAKIQTALDHRIAMSFLVLGMVSDEPIAVDDGSVIATSFPGFVDLMNGMGTAIGEAS